MSNTDFDDADLGDDLLDGAEVEEETPDVEAAEDADEGDEDLVDTVEDGEDDEVDESPRRSRRDARIETLRARAEEERQERIRDRERFERELSELRAQQQVRDRAQETEAQRAERLALMTPEERSQALLGEAMETNRRELAMVTFKMEDQADKRAFDALATVDPLYAKFAPKVEEELRKLRLAGQNIDRERLFKYLVGEHVLGARKTRPSQEQRRGSERVRRQQAPAVRTRADVVDRRQPSDSPAKRLEGVLI